MSSHCSTVFSWTWYTSDSIDVSGSGTKVGREDQSRAAIYGKIDGLAFSEGTSSELCEGIFEKIARERGHFMRAMVARRSGLASMKIKRRRKAIGLSTKYRAFAPASSKGKDGSSRNREEPLVQAGMRRRRRGWR